jgi:hypothetical protein
VVSGAKRGGTGPCKRDTDLSSCLCLICRPKTAVFWDGIPCGSYKGDKNRRARNNVSVLRLLVVANVVPSSSILVTLMMEAIHTFETSVLTSAIQRNIQKDGIPHSHRRGILKTEISITGWAL